MAESAISPTVLAAFALMGGCPDKPAPQVQVVVAPRPVQTITDRSIRDLTQLHGRINGVVSGHDAGGMMHGTVATGVELSQGVVEYPALGIACWWIRDVIVTIHLDATVYIAREYPRGSCRHNAALEHEMRHVALDHAIARAWSGRLGSAASAAADLGMVGPVPGDAVQAPLTALTQRVAQAVDGASQPMMAERARRHRDEIDTPAEYARIRRACP